MMTPGPLQCPARLFDVDAAVDAWGVPPPAPNRWRYADDAHAMAAVQAFYEDLIWAIHHELDGVRWWEGRSGRSPSAIGAMGDVARIWGLDAVSPHSGPRQYNRAARGS